ncbi:HDIG domain-containing protein [Cohnella sp. OV330]|uniref:HD-GYP domain-containing protein n=1 Tax=Cohnella sp. OV330 TaxID=1855288 RepID=UPI0008E1560E|nr:HD-GYP domain-containing protein [Cohnella sp. OV330]SFB35970.1 HDIG domain-containing protein [Cohnella sp. OV330]
MSNPYRSFTTMLAAFVVIFGVLLSAVSYWFISHELIRETSGLTRNAVVKYIEGLPDAKKLFEQSATDRASLVQAGESAAEDDPSGVEEERLAADIRAAFDPYGITDVRFVNLEGQVGFSYNPSKIGSTLTGRERERFDKAMDAGEMLADRTSADLNLWLPVSSEEGKLIGAAEVSKDWSAQSAKILKISLTIVVLLAAGMTLLFFSLRQIFLRSSRVIERQNKELSEMLERVHRTYDESLQAMSSALDSRDNETQGHSLRVTAYAWLLGRQMGIEGEQLEMLYRGALLHDVGKIGIPDSILRKDGPLDEMEWAIMRTHVNMGVRMLAHIEFLGPALDVVRCHHERWDGLGYPDGLRGEQIPICARIFAVCDTYDAITSNRPYRASKSHETAVEELKRFAGTQFCPAVVEAFMELPADTMQRVRELSQQDIQFLSLDELLPKVV